MAHCFLKLRYFPPFPSSRGCLLLAGARWCSLALSVGQALEIVGGVATVLTVQGRVPGEQRACQAGKRLPALPAITDAERRRRIAGARVTPAAIATSAAATAAAAAAAA